MPRNEQERSLKPLIRNMIYEIFEEEFNAGANNTRGVYNINPDALEDGRRTSVGRSGRTKGSVTDPARDRRLKRNRTRNLQG